MRQHIDWQEVYRTLERNQRIIDSGWVPTPQEKMKALLKATAALARPLVGQEDSEGVIEVVAFILGAECYGVDCRYVREVLQMRDYTPVPCTPAFVLGVINFRGRIISVLEARSLLSLPRADTHQTRTLLVLYDSKMEFAIVTDELVGIRRINTKTLQRDMPTLTGAGGEYFQGIARDCTTTTGSTTNIIMLDAAKLLSDNRLVIHEEVVD
ncbi:CheW-like protein [Candidatus Magnetobacterium bavaricum]|uniref:CheW-like protein n=1 Tax=Candidatus Magnetobacterium bavaricum TaxID=29290 RepID=A0A0F3GS80_9BACT|nr:CheW-like protein [Candidatus Magnetobacterium bavaricum]